MTPLRHVWLITLKDLRLFVTDRLALFFFVLFPFLFIILFNFILSGAGQQDQRLELHLLTLEPRGGLSHDIIKAIETEDESQLKPGEPKIIWDKSYQADLEAVRAKKLAGFLVFPEDFTSAVIAGYGANLTVVVDPEKTNTRAALKGVAEAIGASIGQQHVASAAAAGLVAEARWQNPPRSSAQAPPTITMSARTRTSLIKFGVEKVGEVEAENPSNYVIPGYLVMFVFMAAASGSEAVVRERQNRTLERLLASSVSREAILGGIFAGATAKGLVQIAIFWSIGILVFRISLGLSPLAVILLSVMTVIMSAGFSAMLATLARTQRGAGSMAVLTSLVLAPLGGCWWPLFITPNWMQFLAKLTPHGWATTGFNKLLVFGADFGAAVPEMLALGGFTAAFLMVAMARFRTSAI